MAYLFDDANSEGLQGTYPSLWNQQLPLTMSCWFNLDAIPNYSELTRFGRNSGGTDQEYGLLVENSTNKLVARVWTTGVYDELKSTSAITQNQWNHGCAVFAAVDDRRLYYNNDKTTTTNSRTLPTSNWQYVEIGQISWTGAHEFISGQVAEVAYWSVALTDAEVATLSKGYSPLFVRPESLIFYSPLIRDRQELIGATTLSDSTNSPDISAHPRIIYPSNYNIAPFTVAAAANLRRYTLTTLGVG